MLLSFVLAAGAVAPLSLNHPIASEGFHGHHISYVSGSGGVESS